MPHLTIYQKPTCTTCRKVIKLVQENGTPFTAINYYERPLTKAKLKALLKKGGMKAKDILRSKDTIYQNLKLAKTQKPENELISLIIKYPDLLQRPIVEKGERAILARPPETVMALL